MDNLIDILLVSGIACSTALKVCRILATPTLFNSLFEILPLPGVMAPTVIFGDIRGMEVEDAKPVLQKYSIKRLDTAAAYVRGDSNVEWKRQNG